MQTKSTSTTRAVLIAIFSYLAYSCVYLCRLNLSVASVGIKELGLMTDSQIGILSSLFLAAYASGKLMLGRVGDKLPPKLMIVAGLSLSAVTNLIFGLFLHELLPFVLWFLNGFAQSLIWGPILRIVSSNFSAERRSTVLSLMATCIGVGSILGVIVASVGITLFNSVSAGFFLPAGITAVVIILFIIFVHDAKQEETTKLQPMSLKELFRDPAFQRMTIPSFLHGVVKDNINVWMGLYFAVTFKLDLKNLAFYVFIVPLLTLLGRILFLPALRLCRNNESLVAGLSLVLSGVFSLLLALDFLPLGFALVCFGGIACMISMANTTLLSIFPARYLERGCVSSVASYMDVLAYSGAAIGSLVFGIMVESFGYSPMFFVWLVCSAISAVILLNEARDN